MKILVLNGSPRLHGNTAAMVDAFVNGAMENGHKVTVVNVCQKKIAGCFACEYLLCCFLLLQDLSYL